MLKRFIRGRNYYTIKQRKRIVKKPTIKRIVKAKKYFQRRIKRSLYALRPRKLKRKKSLSESYFRRYLLDKRRILYKRTLGTKPDHILNYKKRLRF